MKLKELTQDIFKDAPEWVESVSTSDTGTARGYSQYQDELKRSGKSYGEFLPEDTSERGVILGTGYKPRQKIGRIRTYEFEVSAEMNTACATETVFEDFDHEPNQDDIDRIHDEWVGNLCSSGAILVGLKTDE